uniref:uncharacterized protein LOC105350362 n=1 Tax=Fragaria vesca subsp. vesca TaxID=101020 RepID=UPI0005CACFAC|nr:PREDICTED: uncharacterized protein LOC105350362 [Fragaria vesca subsp. vesca]
MWHLSWPKTTCSTKIGGHEPQDTTATTTTTSTTKCIKASPSSSHCTCLAKLVRKLRKQRRRVGCAKSSSFQCRYDPLSYSLNFDASGYGNLSDDQDYYKFYAFSSRFVANPAVASCPRLITTTTH